MKALDEFLLLLTSHKVIRHEDDAVATDMDEELWRKISLRQHLFNRRIVALVFRRKVYRNASKSAFSSPFLTIRA